ncbi:flavodoxin domain-containing protein [Nocardioides sp.]|uniref:flavodoxin domain-containing protein n=1 Tax=Nocardioides sp. TaxID=35761 RepID=UPI001A2640EA|nr:flavodoxin domain-containing protein [Nocardioides sp.]MBJ7357815.1 flavodoxin domain-containing protein [Nocardioides sp.]
MNVLVAHASRAGATAGIAERIAATISSSGHEAVAREVAHAGDPSGYDAVVLGSAVYMGHWLKQAKAYAEQHRHALSSRPVWLFSSGPIGTSRVDDRGHDLLEVTAPQELPDLVEALRPRDHHVFFGALDPTKLSLAHRALRRLPTGRKLLPEGDFRDWQDVERWAAEIATQLSAAAREESRP